MRPHNFVTLDIRPTEMSTIKYRMEFRMDDEGFWNYVRP